MARKKKQTEQVLPEVEATNNMVPADVNASAESGDESTDKIEVPETASEVKTGTPVQSEAPQRPTYDEWYKTVPKNKNNTKNYDLKRAYELAPQEDLDKFVSDPNSHLLTAYENKDTGEYEFMKLKNHPTINMELDWYTGDTDDAKEFRSKYALVDVGDRYKYVPREKLKGDEKIVDAFEILGKENKDAQTQTPAVDPVEVKAKEKMTAAENGDADVQKSVTAAAEAQAEKERIESDASVVSVIPGSESEGKVAGALKLADDKAMNAGGDALDNVTRSHIRSTADYQALQKGNASGLDEQKTLAIISALENPNERQRDLYTPDQIAVRLQFFRDHLDDIRNGASVAGKNDDNAFVKQQNTFIPRNLNSNIYVPGRDVSGSAKDVNSKANAPSSGVAKTPEAKGTATSAVAGTGSGKGGNQTGKEVKSDGNPETGNTAGAGSAPSATVAGAKPVGKTSDGQDVYLNTDGVGAYYIDPKTKMQIPVAVDYKRKDYTEDDKKEDEGISAELQKKIDDATAKFNDTKATISDKTATYGERVKAIQEQMKLSRTLDELTNPSYEKKMNSRRIVAMFADAFAAIGNMVAVSRGGKSATLTSATAKVDKAEKERRTQLNKEMEYWYKRLESARKSDAAAAKLYSNGALKDATETYKQACKAAIEDAKSKRTLIKANRTNREKGEAAMEKKVASWNKFAYDTAKENQRQVNRVRLEGVKQGNRVSLEGTKHVNRESEIRTRGEEARKTKKTQSGGSKDSGDIKI